MPGRHAASLIPKAEHSPALLKLMRSSLTDEIVEHVAHKAMTVIRCREDQSAADSSVPELPSLDDFIRDICRKSRCHVPTLLCTLVYLERLKERLPVRSCGSPSTRHRVFVAALIVAAKYLNDSSPYNKHWVKYAVHFRLEEVNLMERQLLCLLDFDLRIGEPELIETFAPFLGPIEAGMAEKLIRRQSRPMHHRMESDSDSEQDDSDDDLSECEMDSDVDTYNSSSSSKSTAPTSVSPTSSLVTKTQAVQLSRSNPGSSASSQSSYSPQNVGDVEEDSYSISTSNSSRPTSWSSNRSVSTTASSLDYSCGSSSPIDELPSTPRDALQVPKLPLYDGQSVDIVQHLQTKFDVQHWMYGGQENKRNAIVL